MFIIHPPGFLGFLEGGTKACLGSHKGAWNTPCTFLESLLSLLKSNWFQAEAFPPKLVLAQYLRQPRREAEIQQWREELSLRRVSEKRKSFSVDVGKRLERYFSE